MGDDLRQQLRRRLEAAAPDRGPDFHPGAPAFTGMVYNGGHMPTSLPGQFLVYPVRYGGTEAEGATGSLAVDTSGYCVVTVVGTKVPVPGEVLVCRLLSGRWVAERYSVSGSGVTIAGCSCTNIPTTLHMTSSKPLSNNQMLQSATLQYQTVPACLSSLGLGSSAFLSTTQFPDLVTGDYFWYHLTCFLGYYVITPVYCYSHYGSPYRGFVLYRWLAGFPPNTCSPFSLTSGIIFPGGDASCVVTITQ